MFNKYFELVKSLYDAVFVSHEGMIPFMDFLYVIGYTIALIACAIIFVVFCYFICRIPFSVYKKLVKNKEAKLDELRNTVTGSGYDKETKKIAGAQYMALLKKYSATKVCYVLGVIFLYIPFVIPTVLFIVSCVRSLF